MTRMTLPRQRRPRYDQGPWSIRYLQLSDNGKRSRPVVLNAKGQKVRPSKAANAIVHAAAPELYEALDAVTEQAVFLLSVLRYEHPHMNEPAALAEAKRLLRRVRHDLDVAR